MIKRTALPLQYWNRVRLVGQRVLWVMLTYHPSLCGFQVFVRLGRQKWRLKGKIETDDSQTWDEEEKIFIPNLHEQFEIKVWCIMVGLESVC